MLLGPLLDTLPGKLLGVLVGVIAVVLLGWSASVVRALLLLGGRRLRAAFSSSLVGSWPFPHLFELPE